MDEISIKQFRRLMLHLTDLRTVKNLKLKIREPKELLQLKEFMESNSNLKYLILEFKN